MKKLIYVLTFAILAFHLTTAEAQETNGTLVAQSGLTFKTGSVACDIDKAFSIVVYVSKTYAVYVGSN